jgi:hypothetical protein
MKARLTDSAGRKCPGQLWSRPGQGFNQLRRRALLLGSLLETRAEPRGLRYWTGVVDGWLIQRGRLTATARSFCGDDFSGNAQAAAAGKSSQWHQLRRRTQTRAGRHCPRAWVIRIDARLTEDSAAAYERFAFLVLAAAVASSCPRRSWPASRSNTESSIACFGVMAFTGSPWP